MDKLPENHPQKKETFWESLKKPDYSFATVILIIVSLNIYNENQRGLIGFFAWLILILIFLFRPLTNQS